MDRPPTYSTPMNFLEALAQRLHTIPERLSAARAQEELIRWLEATLAAGEAPAAPFLRITLRLFYEQTYLSFGPEGWQVTWIADRLR